MHLFLKLQKLKKKDYFWQVSKMFFPKGFSAFSFAGDDKLLQT